MSAAQGAQYSKLWGVDGERWDPKSRLPDFSYAGYRRGDAAIPTPAISASVKDFGAKGDGVTDDTKAFKDAIAAVSSGAILVPAGRYKITDFIHIRKSNIVLRGEGTDKTVLWFPTPLSQIHPNGTAYSYDYGFLTIQGDSVETLLANVTAEAKRGENWVNVSTTTGMSVGQQVKITVQVFDAADKSLESFLYSGDPGTVDDGRASTRLVAKIMEVQSGRIRIDRALRFDTRLAWSPKVVSFGPKVVESGIENMRFDFPDQAYQGHFNEKGFNAIELRGAVNCWVRNVWIHNADMGVLVVYGSTFNTVDGVILTTYSGRGALAGHHAFQFVQSQDNVITRHDIRAAYIHDMSVEQAAGNVYSEGKAQNATLDHHTLAPYANLYTNIDVGAGTRIWESGGDFNWGWHAAGWSTLWNIRAARNLNYPPDGFGPLSMNLVGFTTAAASVTDSLGKWFETIPPANLMPKNLHLAQLERRGSGPPPTNQPPSATLTQPGSGAVFTSPAAVSMTASASDPDGTLKRVEFYSNGTLIGTAATPSSPGVYSFTWTGVGQGTYSINAKAIDDKDAAGVSVSASVTVTGSGGGALPSPWANADIGTVGFPGSATYSGGNFTVQASGADIWNNVDAFHYVHQSISGDGEIVARLAAMSNTDAWAKAGLMIRSSLAANSVNAFMCLTPSKGGVYQARLSTGAQSTDISGGSAIIPHWIKLSREGATITAYRSPDGSVWTRVGAYTLPLGSTAYFGLAYTSHNDATKGTALFSSVSVTVAGGGNQPPVSTLTSPSNGAAYGASPTVNLTANAADADGSVKRVDFYANGGLIGSATAPASPNVFAYAWTGVAGGSYALTAKATDDAGAQTVSAAVNITVASPPPPPPPPPGENGLPTPWLNADIGSVGYAGSATYENGTFNVLASGADVWNNEDGFHFVHRTLSGNGDIVARLLSLQNNNAWAKAGVMIRASLAANSANAFMCFTPSNGGIFQARLANGEGSTNVSGGSGGPTQWVRLNRTGTVITAYRSQDGSTWTKLGAYTLPLGTTAYIGIAHTSHTNGSKGASSFSNVSVTATP